MSIRTLLSVILASLFSACFASALFAQESQRLTVSVTGADGAPVADLTKADFNVQVAGKPRVIDNFVPPNLKPAATPKLDANEYSNAPGVPDSSGVIFVVLDTIHTRYADERDMRAMILKFLGKAAQSKHPLTLGILHDDGLHIYHDYRSGSDLLLAAMVKAGLGGLKDVSPPTGVSDAEVAAEAARLAAFSKGDLSNATSQDQLMHSNIDLPLVLFQDVSNAAYGLPGRKSLVWVTNIVPFDIDPKTMQFMSPKEANYGVAVNGAQVGGSKDMLSSAQVKRLLPIWRRSTRALFDGGVAVYPVEARGAFSSGSDALIIAIMKTLAELTGGKAFYGSNDPFPEILKTADGNTAGYTLGLDTESSVSPGFHHLQSSVNKQGVKVSGPEGFFPREDGPKVHAQDDMSLALQSPLTSTGVLFKVGFTGNEDASGKKKVNFVISLAGDSGVLNEATRTVDLGIMAVAKNVKGDTVGKMSEAAGGQFPPEAVAQIKELGFQLKRSIELPVGDCAVHIVLRDNQDGRVGSLTVPLKVQ